MSSTSSSNIYFSDSDFSSDYNYSHCEVTDINSVEDDLNLFLPTLGSKPEKWVSTPSSNPELLNVNIYVSDDVVHLKLTDNMIIQDVADIIGDMFGIIDERLSVEFNGETLEPYKKLKCLATNRDLELKIILHSINWSQKEPQRDECKAELQNVFVQTKPNILMISRINQTPFFPLVDAATNTPHVKAVQVDHIISPNDKVLEAKNYVMFDTYVKNQNEHAIMIQKSIRRFLAQKRILQMKKERDLKILQSQLHQREVTHELLQQDLKIILEKRPVPFLSDFSKAYCILAEWLGKEKEKLRFKKGLERKAVMNEIFKKEMESLNYINSRRMTGRENKEAHIKTKLLNEASKPIYRNYPKGNKTSIEGKNTELAKMYNDILFDLKKSGSSNEERLSILQHFKDFLLCLKVPECTSEMISIAEKESQMILLGVNNKYLEGARKRLLELFLHFSTEPEFNPGIYTVMKSKETGSLIQCRICKELKPASEFNVDIIKGLTDCTICTMTRELSYSSSSLIPYKAIQKDLLSNEQKLGCSAEYVNLLQSSDFYYLVQTIWEGRSSLSEINDIKLLKFSRWNQDEIWSPWNCILLAGKEGELHQSILNKESFYGQHFIRKIQNKHIQAKIKFKNLEHLFRKLKFGDNEVDNSNDNDSGVDCPLLNNLTNSQSKKLSSKFVFTEPVSDLIFP